MDDSLRHIEVSLMACVAAPIIGGLDRYPSNDVPKPSIGHTYDTLKHEEPLILPPKHLPPQGRLPPAG
jgi:hypothetical protein